MTNSLTLDFLIDKSEVVGHPMAASNVGLGRAQGGEA